MERQRRGSARHLLRRVMHHPVRGGRLQRARLYSLVGMKLHGTSAVELALFTRATVMPSVGHLGESALGGVPAALRHFVTHCTCHVLVVPTPGLHRRLLILLWTAEDEQPGASHRGHSRCLVELDEFCMSARKEPEHPS